MQNPMSLEALSRDLMRSRQQEAAQDALADMLPRSSAFAPAAAARQQLASALRAMAVRLDPCVVCEPCLVVPQPR